MILTQLKTFDPNRREDDEEYALKLVEEQDRILKDNGWFNDCLTAYVALVDNKKYIFDTIDNLIQMLALKEGADLVEFDDGNIGFIGYYGNNHYDPKNCFKLMYTWQSFQETFGNKLSWEEAERRVGYSLDKANNFDECLYFDELLAKVNEGR